MLQTNTALLVLWLQNPTSGSQLKIQHKGSSSTTASSTTITNAPPTVQTVNAPHINPSSLVTTTPASPTITQKPSALPQVSSSSGPIPVSSSLNSLNSSSGVDDLNNTNNSEPILPSQSATRVVVSTHILSSQILSPSTESAVPNPCSTDCYESKVVPILKEFINESLTEEEMVRQIKENTQTNKNQEFQSKVACSIEYAKKYIILKGEIKETTKQINEIQNTNSILGDELSLEEVKKAKQIEKIKQKTSEVNAIKFTRTSFTHLVNRRITAVANYTIHLQEALDKEIQLLETKKRRWGYRLTSQEAKDLRSFKRHYIVLQRKAQGNTEIQNMKNNLGEIEKIITKKSNMIAENTVKVKSNEDGKTLALRKQEQIKIELKLN